VNKNILLQCEMFRNIRAAFTTTVYAFLDPGRPSAARDFFCLEFSRSVGTEKSIAHFVRVQGCSQISRLRQINCGSGLARNGGVSVNIHAGCSGLFASKPAPTVECRCAPMLWTTPRLVGASLPAMAY
jgi:hypothetical protein